MPWKHMFRVQVGHAINVANIRGISRLRSSRIIAAPTRLLIGNIRRPRETVGMRQIPEKDDQDSISPFCAGG